MSQCEEKTADRKAWLGTLARAPASLLKSSWDKAGLSPSFEWLRQPEIGAVMVRGRAGGTGAAFNLGEMTVTRCSIQLSSGEIGHGYVQGRDKDRARIAALCDALLQTHMAETIRDTILVPARSALGDGKTARESKAAATKVDFFTLVRGED